MEEKDKSDPSSQWDDIKWLSGFTSLPLILKGILTGERVWKQPDTSECQLYYPGVFTFDELRNEQHWVCFLHRFLQLPKCFSMII